MRDTEVGTVVDHLPNLAALIPGTTGKLSVRRGDRFVVTPTDIPYEAVTVANIPVMTLDGE